MDSERRKILSALCHGAIFFSVTNIVSIVIPIVIILLTDDSIVKDNAKESINFHINIYIYALVFGILIWFGWRFPFNGIISFVLFPFGIPLLVLLAIFAVVMAIIAIINVKNNPNQPYRYPFIFHLL
ncbi:MAG: DUF4870 domain-containing protein [Okeania sp. SIO3I5]|uniref:DUF4870 domain-containing protein n=1 Tax=Okeania sp. SIO3I5 TaxID=2607805 RepID=UPI0013B99EA4|nr:DUF4870 domain-containing protein [Okeania sp. SIO3I5]NEQ41589.1 DUF4870 domain-containing protein [Okeania sp. SIO3I5]